MLCSICRTGRRRAAGYIQWVCFQPGALRETKREGREVIDGIAVLDDCETRGGMEPNPTTEKAWFLFLFLFCGLIALYILFSKRRRKRLPMIKKIESGHLKVHKHEIILIFFFT
jgi:hypothetical protein